MALEFESRIPEEVPGSLPVYRLEEPEAYPGSAARLAELATRIGLRGKAHEIRTSDEWTMHQEGPFELAVHRESGALVGRHRERYQRHDERTFELADQDAQEIAGRFVEGSALLPAHEAQPTRVTHLRSAGRALEGGDTQEVVLDAGVVYRRTMEGAPVDGPGGLAMVHVDPEGEIAGFRVVWRPVAEPIGEVGILPPGEAYQSMERVAERMRGDVTVTRAAFGYFEQGVSERQRFLQPAYAMIYVVQDEEVAFKSAEVIPAGERVFESLIGEKRFPAPPQPARAKQDRIG